MNPLNSFLTNVLGILNGAALTVLILGFTWTGFLFVKGAIMGGGVADNERAKVALFACVIGGLIIFGANLIAGAIQGAAH
jgi:TrbC/VIRB2 pilin